LSSRTSLPYADPRVAHGAIFRAYARFLATPTAGWLSRNIVWKIDPYLLRLSRGRLGLGLMLPTALLETLRRNGVIYFHDGDLVTIVASKLGAAEHPSWYHNAVANPDVRLGDQPFRAVVIDDEPSRTRLWDLADLVFPPYAVYRERAARVGRTIPILQLVPR
jgi:deazaflavin-dependent oxidoreductase (nitroreductase family)